MITSLSLDELFDLTSTYLSVLRVEHLMIIRLSLLAASSGDKYPLLIRVLEGHIDKEERVLGKYGIVLSSMGKLKEAYIELYRAYVEGSVSKKHVSRLLDVVVEHDNEVSSLLEEAYREFVTRVRGLVGGTTA